MSEQPLVQVSDLHKRFGDNEVLKGIDATVDAGNRYQRLRLLLCIAHRATYLSSRVSSRPCPKDRTRQTTQ